MSKIITDKQKLQELEEKKNKLESNRINKVCANYKKGCINIMPFDSDKKLCDLCKIYTGPPKLYHINYVQICRFLNYFDANKIEDKELEKLNKIEKQLINTRLLNIMKNINDDQYESLTTYEYNKVNNNKIDYSELPKLGYLVCISCNQNNTIDNFFTTKNNFSNICNICLDRNKLRIDLKDKSDRVTMLFYQIDKRRELKHNYKKIMRLNIYHDKSIKEKKDWIDNNRDIIKLVYEKQSSYITTISNIYKDDATKKNKSFDLTNDDILLLVNNNCYYCGELSSNLLMGINLRYYNKSYNLDNCVSCCKLCNYMKSDMLDDFDFLLIIEHILTVNNFIKGVQYPGLFKNCKSLDYENMLMTREDYNNMRKDVCYICNKENTKEHQNNINIVNPRVCYIKDNCQSCCGTCNYIKRDLTLSDFLYHIYRIYLFMNKLNCIYDSNFSINYNRMLIKYKANIKYDSKYLIKDRVNNYGTNKKYKLYDMKKKIDNSKEYDGININNIQGDINPINVIYDKMVDLYYRNFN
jgi:hypothetical protein